MNQVGTVSWREGFDNVVRGTTRKYVTSYVQRWYYIPSARRPYDLRVVHIQSIGILFDCIMFIAIDAVQSYTCIVNWRQGRLRKQKKEIEYTGYAAVLYGPRLFHRSNVLQPNQIS